MTTLPNPFVVEFDGEDSSNQIRQTVGRTEPHSLKTYTPTQAVIASAAGAFVWTPEGRRLFDYSSGVLVTNLGHNPRRWMERFRNNMGWTEDAEVVGDFLRCPTMTAYNAVTELEATASERLLRSLNASPGGSRLDCVMWSASGSEAVQKALWACMQRDPHRSHVLATRYGFHGKKGLSGAVTGSESDPERDPRVHFISFPREECSDMDAPEKVFKPEVYRKELDDIWQSTDGTIGCLITEPYLGGGGSYHPPREYMQLLQDFCREHDILFILDEVQANFGRTGRMYAFESYGIEPDFVCLGKGLGNGVPVSAAVGRSEICQMMGYGATSDTWSANPISSAAVIATLDEFESTNILERTRHLSEIFVQGLRKLRDTGVVVKIRGEGMVFGIECGPVGTLSPAEAANAVVHRSYRGKNDSQGIHLLGPLAGCVLRVSPPMCMTDAEAEESLTLLHEFVSDVAASAGS